MAGTKVDGQFAVDIGYGLGADAVNKGVKGMGSGSDSARASHGIS